MWFWACRSLLPVLLLYYLLMLGLSWRRWMSPIADSGRELDLPRRLLEGELLYRDVHYLYPPLAPYLKALLYRIFGIDLQVLQASGVVASLLIVLLVTLIGRRILGRGEAGVATAAVILFCVFKPTGNMISPYAYAALYGVVFALGTLHYALRYIECPRWPELVVAGILTGLAGVTKQEFGVAAGSASAAAIFMVAVGERAPLLVTARRVVIYAVPVLGLALPVYAWFFWQVGWRTMVEDCHILFTHLPASMIFYNARRTGLDQPFLSLLQLLGGGAVLALMIGLISVVAEWRLIRHRVVQVGLGASVLATLLIRFVVGAQWDGSPLRFLPVLLGWVIIDSWRRRDGAGWRGEALRLTIATYSLAVLARVALRVPSGGAFGSFFLPTSLIILVWFLMQYLPGWVSRHGWRVGATAGAARWRRVVGIGLVLVLGVTTVVYGLRYRRLYREEIRTPRGHFYAPAASGKVLRDALNYLATRSRPGDPVVVLPEGSELAFLTGRRSPLRHQILIPGLMSTGDERQAIETIERQDVELILIVNRPMREFGATRFGEDFYPELGRWIDRHYQVEQVFGAGPDRSDPAVQIGDPAFFIKVYARRRGVNAP